MEHSTALIQLIISEAIKDLQSRFEGATDNSEQIESHLFELGKKPGFALIGLLSRSGQDFELEDIPKFLGNRFSPIILNVPAQNVSLSNHTILLQYKKTQSTQMPQWFTALSGPANTQQQLWLKAYASFYMGVFTGALTHMGYRVTPSFEQPSPTSLDFKFTVDELDPKTTWEFVCMNH